MCSSNAVSALIEELQYTFGQGPCIEAYDEGRPVLEPNLDQPAWPRWLAFTGPALDAGVRAVFGFPMRDGAVRLGALNLYRDRPGALSDEQHADALVLAPTGSSSAEANHSTSASTACETRSDRALPTTSPATSCETMSYRAMTSPW